MRFQKMKKLQRLANGPTSMGASTAMGTMLIHEDEQNSTTLITNDDTFLDEDSDKTAFSGLYCRLDWLVAQYVYLRGEGNSEQWMKSELWAQLKNGGYLGAKLSPLEVGFENMFCVFIAA